MLYLALYLRFAGVDNTDMGGTPAGGIVGIVWIYLYAFGWSFGHSVACYIVAAEIFPTRIVCFQISSPGGINILTAFSAPPAWASASS